MQANEFLLLAEHLPEGMLLLAADGEILAVNRGAARLLEQNAGQLAGNNLGEITGLQHDELIAKLKPCTRSRSPIPLAFKSSSAEATVKMPSCEGFLVSPAEEGKLAQIILRLHDGSSHHETFLALNQEIEKQRRVLRKLEDSREQLRVSEENLSITLNSIGDAVMVSDKEGALVSLNPVAEKLTGWTTQEAFGLPIKKIFPIIDASTREVIENPVEKVLATGETVYLSNHTTLISRDGSEYQIADSAAPIRERNGSEILGMVLVFHDVTEQYQLREENKKSLKKLESNEKLYRDLVESTAAVAWEYDLMAHHFTYMGDKIFKLTGYPSEQWTGFDSWADRIHPDDRDDVVSYCQLETERGLDHTIEYRNICADGKIVWLRDEVTVIMDGGKPVMMRGYFFDITEHRQTEEALRRAQKMDAIGQMAGGIAHDFNNIISIIQGNINLLEQQIASDDKAKKRIESIRHSSERAAKLTRQLLSFSRHEAFSVKATNVNEVISSIDNLITQSITPQVEVEYHYDKDLWLTDIDPGDLEDALLNLVLNARDALNGRGKLTIETYNSTLDKNYCMHNPGVVAGDYVQLTVSDNGSGITQEQQVHIFDPFYTTKEQGKGTGLGLSMVFGFVKRSGGHIKVYSEPDIGSTFRLYLPRSSAAQHEDETNGSNNVLPHKGEETILIVDDELALLELVEELLQALGYKTITASSGVEALQRLAESPEVALLFSDVVMPGGINGYELAEQAVELYPDLKVILTSGYTKMASARNGQARFNADLISKPYKLSDLTSRIRHCLDGS